MLCSVATGVNAGAEDDICEDIIVEDAVLEISDDEDRRRNSLSEEVQYENRSEEGDDETATMSDEALSAKLTGTGTGWTGVGAVCIGEKDRRNAATAVTERKAIKEKRPRCRK
jgi:hypothetical protein